MRLDFIYLVRTQSAEDFQQTLDLLLHPIKTLSWSIYCCAMKKIAQFAGNFCS